MGNEAVSLPTLRHEPGISSYEHVETLQAVEATMQMLSNYVEHLALVVVTLHFEHEGRMHLARSLQTEQSTRYYLEHLRSRVRKTDSVFLLQQSFYFLLPGATLQGGQIVQTRLWEALLWRVHNTHEGSIIRPSTMTIGHSAYPEPFLEVGACIMAACEAQQSYELLAEKATRKLPVRQKATQTTPKEAELPQLARRLGIPYLTLLPRNLPQQVQQSVDPKLAQELQCYPIGRERGTLTVAMVNPQDHTALARLHHETGLQIFPVLAHPGELQIVLEQLI